MVCALLQAKSPKMVRQRDPRAREMTKAFGKETEALVQAFDCSAPSVGSLLLEFGALVSSMHLRRMGKLRPGVC